MKLLDTQSKVALDAQLWRLNTGLKRHRKDCRKVFMTMVSFGLMSLVFAQIFKSVPGQINATQSITVTSTTPYPDQNNFGDIAYNASFSQCAEDSVLWNIAYVLPSDAPSTQKSAMEQIATVMGKAFTENNDLSPVFDVFTYASQSELDSATASRDYINQQYCFAYSFPVFELDVATNTYNFEMDIQFGQNLIGSTRENQTQTQNLPFYMTVTNTDGQKTFESLDSRWATSGFQQLMTTATDVIISLVNEEKGVSTTPNFSVAYLPMNTGQFEYSQIASILMIYVLACLQLFAVHERTLQVVEEKHEADIRRMLSLSGLTPLVEVIYYWTTMAMISIPCCLFLAIVAKFSVMTNVGFFVIFFLLVMFVLQSTLQRTIIAWCVKNKAVKVLLVVSYFIIMTLLTVLTAYKPNANFTTITVLSIVAPVQQILYFSKMATVKLLDPDVSSALNFGDLNAEVFNTKFSWIFWIAFMMTCFYSVLLAYLWPLYINVDEEKSLKFYYLFQSEYWSPKPAQEEGQLSQKLLQSVPESLNDSARQMESPLQEEEKLMVASGQMENVRGDVSTDTLKINHLTRKFGKQTAVDELTLTLFKDQILVLLGHNGAGKTTTINMLIKKIKATHGTAITYGKDLLKLDYATDMISVCPQENVLLDKLTVLENLQFFCKFKQVQNIDQQIEFLLQKFKMVSQKNQLPPTLSGGQKRKLQLMLALIGESKIVLLDEPSSGMDPNLRRELWQTLRELRQGRIVILTTHYMDEAEFLGDRVAIMSKGKLMTCGSSLFLKNKYSDSFLIEVTRKDKSLQSDLSAFDQLVLSYVLRAGLDESHLHKSIDEAGRDIYHVPKSVGVHFRELFSEVDASLTELNIEEYLVRTSSLEEVFIKIGETENLAEPTDGHDKGIEPPINHSEQSLSLEKTPLGERSSWRTFKAFFLLHLQQKVASYCVGFCLICVFTFTLMIGLIMQSRHIPTLALNDVSNSMQGVPLPLLSYYYDESGTAPSSFWTDNDIQFDGSAGFKNVDTLNVTQSLQNWADCIYYQNTPTTVYGDYYVYTSPSDPTSTDPLQVAVYGNLKSMTSQNVFGALMLENIAQWYTSEQSLSLTFNNAPFVQSRELIAQTQPGFISQFGDVLVVLAIVLQIIFGLQIGSQLESGYYNLLMTKSGDKFSYFFTAILNDFIFWNVVMFTWLMFFAIGGVTLQGFWLSIMLFAVAQPLIVIFMVAYFQLARGNKDAKFAVGSLSALGTVAYLWAVVLSSYIMFTSPKAYTTVKHIAAILFLIPIDNLVNAAWMSCSRIYYAKLFNVSADTVGIYELQAQFIWQQAACIVFFAVSLLMVLCRVCKPSKGKYANLQPTPVEMEDGRVREERNRIIDAVSDDLVVVKNVVKQYEGKDPNPPEQAETDRPVIMQAEAQKLGKELAVNGISFGVKRGEIFALLGLSGAGKTSTFNMILGEESISGGQISFRDKDMDSLFKQPEKLDGVVGYCPQHNSIQGELTVRQSLWYICELLGVRVDQVDAVIEDTMQRYNLKDHENTKAGALSGGNKRKLTCAMALLGNPEVMIVDEVSAGVDPVARRLIWKAMKHEAHGSALLLTTHTLEEAEALANKIGIMAKGKLKCLGSLQQIQTTYGSGFEIEINLRTDDLFKDLQPFPLDDQNLYKHETVKTALQKWTEQLTQDYGVALAMDLLTEFSSVGIFSAEFERVQAGQAIDMDALMRDIQLKNELALIVQALEEHAGTQVVSFDGSYLVLRLQKVAALSYGRLYAIMEELKVKRAIREYSCKQATLEQIFNSFAREDNLRVFNRRASLQKRNQ